MTKKTNPRKDFTQRAFDVFQQAIGEAEPEEANENKAQTEQPAPDENENCENKISK